MPPLITVIFQLLAVAFFHRIFRFTSLDNYLSYLSEEENRNIPNKETIYYIINHCSSHRYSSNRVSDYSYRYREYVRGKK